VLFVIVTQLFQTRGHFNFCGRQDFVSALETDDNRSTKTFGLQITICMVFSYEIIRHVNLFSAQHSYMTIICNDIYGENCMKFYSYAVRIYETI